ncbi:MAG TPA: carboxypeptidase-like regulatory domain-containing protein [Acidobacteriaceae bacterium]|nr:carboxypeptidase-like regulatory domain-containing protein [Acidobacteriaceae bacterium]
MTCSAVPVSNRIRQDLQRRVMLVLALFALAALGPALLAQNFGQRDLQGKVIGDHGTPISGAIVYLENSRNSDVKTFITTSDGSYRFDYLADDTDYTVWAAFHGRKSSKRTLSSFDQRKIAYFDLHISVAAPASSSGSGS